MCEVRNGENKGHRYLHPEIFYGGQKLRKYVCSLRVTVEVSPLLICSYIGELRNGRKFKCENEPFIVLIFILRRVLYSICFLKDQLNLQPLG